MKFPTAITGALLIAFSGAAQAEIVASSEEGFVTRDTAVVDATPMEVWLALISPGKWWNDAHTWSGDAANMSLKPQAGGCFCERIPEDLDADRVTLEGSVEHMRVIQAFPERALRMSGGLGPLQSEPVGGVLTIVISDAEEGTQIVWEYVVGGYMRYDVDVIAPAVDGVMTQQLDGLASLLGRLDTPVPLPEVAVPEVEDAPVEEVDPEAVEEKPRSSVDEAFSDLSDN